MGGIVSGGEGIERTKGRVKEMIEGTGHCGVDGKIVSTRSDKKNWVKWMRPEIGRGADVKDDMTCCIRYTRWQEYCLPAVAYT